MKNISTCLILVFFIFNTALAAEPDLEKKWLGTWKNVNSLEKILPEEAHFRTRNIYDNFEVTRLTRNGFEYRNIGNDVGYGPNQQTYSQGYAVFTDEGNAEDKLSGLQIFYYQGNKKWDRGLSVKSKNEQEQKHFKQTRTTFDAGFNCDKAGTHIEKRICAVPLLARADKETGLLYKKLRKSLGNSAKSELRNTQRAWLKKRNKKCQDKDSADEQCLSALYAERILQLRKMSGFDVGQKTSLFDASYMKALYSRSNKLWDDTVLRLVFKSYKQDEFVQKWMTFNPGLKSVFSDNEAVFTGEFEYSTIVWPADVLVKQAFQLVVNDKAQLWFSIRTKAGDDVDVRTHFGIDNKPTSVINWLDLKKR